jgi:hypothetical protein
MQDTTKRDQPRRIPRREQPMPTHKPDPSALAKLLDEWMQGDQVEQRETFEVLRHSLDDNRPPGYKLFS